MQVPPSRLIPLAKLIPSPRRRRRQMILRPVTPTPAGESGLRRLLHGLVRAEAEQARQLVIEAVRRERRAVGFRDAAGDDAAAALAELKRRAEAAGRKIAADARAEFAREEERFRERWEAIINAGTDFDIGRMIAADDVAEILNVRAVAFAELIQGVSSQMQTAIAQAAIAGIYGGSTDDVARAIQSAMEIGFRRARLIARDQMAKLNSDMNEYRQQQIGVEQYQWRTILDGRERPHHHERNGKVFSWSTPPKGGHPGREINCRCRALAIITLPGELAALPVP